MRFEDSHLSDEQLLQDLDGEAQFRDAKRIARHLAQCWSCRARRRELESAIADFMRLPERELPPADGPRSLLKARVSQLAAQTPRRAGTRRGFTWALAAAGLCAGVTALLSTRMDLRFLHPPHPGTTVVSAPDPRLTPGAAVLLSRRAVCTQPGSNNKPVPVSVQRKVFEAYGIAGAEPREYEVDYLITPALGGADDIHNLWPQSHSSTVWNAEVKDALEDRLRQMVCDGSLDLSEAQQEIASNWIGAYKKYFHTNRPIAGRESHD